MEEPEITRGSARSADGTGLSYMRLGGGPPLVVCHGSFAVGADWMDFARHLATTHTVYLYDRRGRGLSPYIADDFAIDAEVDDLAVIVDLAGPNAAVLGHSFGGGCALSFAAKRAFAGSLILYEPRHAICQSVSRGHAPEVERLVAAGDREGAMACVLAKVVGMPAEAIANFRQSPLWPKMCATVDAFAKEVRFLDTLCWRGGELASITGSVSLLIGEKSHHSPEEAAADAALKTLLPGACIVTIPSEGHFAYVTAPEALAGIVARCLAGATA